MDPKVEASVGEPYPDTSLYVPTLASMYTLTNVAACSSFDAYCRVVAGKEALFDVELDASVTSIALQITLDVPTAMRAATVAANCDAQCWTQASVEGNPTLHLAGEKMRRAGKNVFRIRIPAHANTPNATWLLEMTGDVQVAGLGPETTAITKRVSYAPKRIARAYFEGDALTLVVAPIRINGIVPANFPNIFQIANNVGARIPLPIASIRIGDVVDIATSTKLETSDEFNAALRSFTQQVHASPGRTYWYGIFSTLVRQGPIAGMGFQPGFTAIGWDSPANWQRSMTHEIGHNLGLPHTPCGNPTVSDARYPYPNGALYAPYPALFHYPFDLSLGLERVEENTDVMGYCGGQFFSDYSISNIWKSMMPVTIGVVPLNEAAINKGADAKALQSHVSASISFPPVVAAIKPYGVADLYKYWDAHPPMPKQGSNEKGHVYSWTSGLSNALAVRRLTTMPELPLPGVSIEILHPDGIWYSGLGYRTSEGDSLELWTPGTGVPITIRVFGM